MQALSGVVDICSAAFDRLSTAVPQPQLIPFGKGKVFRHAEQMLEQAIVQKLSRVISGLHAVKVLMEHGLYQEVAVLFRVLDELTEDIHFLCLPLFDQPRSALHDEYLQSFYQEDHQNPDDLTQPFKKRQTISRKRIHSALAKYPVLRLCTRSIAPYHGCLRWNASTLSRLRYARYAKTRDVHPRVNNLLLPVVASNNARVFSVQGNRVSRFFV
jgi:hypothetical protein